MLVGSSFLLLLVSSVRGPVSSTHYERERERRKGRKQNRVSRYGTSSPGLRRYNVFLVQKWME